MLRLGIFMLYFSLVFCAKYYRFDDEVYIFPDIEDQMTVNNLADAVARCANFAGANLVSINSFDIQLFLSEKLNGVYVQYSDASAFFGAITGGILNGTHLWQWPNGYVFYDQISQQPINGAFSAWLSVSDEPDNLGNADCYYMILFSKNSSSERWGWENVKCTEIEYDFYVPCSKPLETDKQVYVVNESSDFSIDVRVFSDRYPLALNSSLNSEIVSVFDDQSFAYQISNVSTAMAGEHMIMAIYDGVRAALAFNLNVQYLSLIEIERIEDDYGYLTYLRCSVSGYPAPVISWSERSLCFFENNAITEAPPARDVSNSSGVMFRVSERIRVGGSSASVFTCTAGNAHAVQSAAVHVHNDSFRELLKVSLVINVSCENSATIRWFHSEQLLISSLLDAIQYEVEIESYSPKCPFFRKSLFRYPTAYLLIEDLCAETEYEVKITSLFQPQCDISINQTEKTEFFVGDSNSSNDGSGEIVLSIFVVILLLILGITWYQRFQQRSRKYKFVPNVAISYRELLHSQGEYRPQELPGEPGYMAASNDSSSSFVRRISNVRSRAATFLRNHLYSHIGNQEAPESNSERRTGSVVEENPYEVVTTSAEIYSYAGDGPSSPTQTVYSFAADIPAEVPKYTTIKRKPAPIGKFPAF